MKQGRAFGLGVVLATQNPMDLDYRALSNAGLWLVGRLQTDADRARVVEAMASEGGLGERRGTRRARARGAVGRRQEACAALVRDAQSPEGSEAGIATVANDVVVDARPDDAGGHSSACGVVVGWGKSQPMTTS